MASSTEDLNASGVAHALQGRFEDAISEFERALAINPDRAVTHYNLGLAYAQSGRLDKALNEFLVALRLAPHVPEVRHNLALVLLQQGRTDEGIQQFERLLRISPEHALAHHNLGAAYLQKGNVAAAVAEAKLAYELGHKPALRLLFKLGESAGNPRDKRSQMKTSEVMQWILERETTEGRLRAIECGQSPPRMSTIELVIAVELMRPAGFLELVAGYWDRFDHAFFEAVQFRLCYLSEQANELLSKSFKGIELNDTMRFDSERAREAARYPEVYDASKAFRRRGWILVSRANSLRRVVNEGLPLQVALQHLRLPSDGFLDRQDTLDTPPYFLEPSPDVFAVVERMIAVGDEVVRQRMSETLSRHLSEMYAIKSKSGRMRYFISFVRDSLSSWQIGEGDRIELPFKEELEFFQAECEGPARACFLSMYRCYCSIVNSIGRGESMDTIQSTLLEGGAS